MRNSKLHLFNSLLFLILLTSVQLAWAGGNVEKRKTIERSFKVNKDVRLEVDNRYGMVHVNTWNKNQVDLKVEIIVKRRKEGLAKELLDRIEIDIDQEGKSMLSFETQIEGNVNTSGSESMEINYHLHIPKTADLELENRYGDIFLAAFNGPVNIDLAYGHLKAEQLTHQQSTLDLAYGNGELGEMQAGELETSYFSIDIGKLGEVVLDNAYGKVEIEKAEKIKVNSRYGDLKIGELFQLEGEVAYANLEIRKLEGSLILEARYAGEVEVSELAASVRTVDIDSRYSSIDLRYTNELEANLEFETKHANLRYDDKHIDFYYLNESTFKDEYKGTLNGGGETRIRVLSGYGDVRFRPLKDFIN